MRPLLQPQVCASGLQRDDLPDENTNALAHERQYWMSYSAQLWVASAAYASALKLTNDIYMLL